MKPFPALSNVFKISVPLDRYGDFSNSRTKSLPLKFTYVPSTLIFPSSQTQQLIGSEIACSSAWPLAAHQRRCSSSLTSPQQSLLAGKNKPARLPLRTLMGVLPMLQLLLLLLLLPPQRTAVAQQPPGSFYGGSVEWTLLPDAAHTVEFHIRTHWQRSFSAYKGSASDGFSAVGDLLSLQGQDSVFFSFGDSSPVTELTATVTSTHHALDIVSVLSVVRHVYSAPCRNMSLSPAFFPRPLAALAAPLTRQEMLVARSPWIAQLTVCCAATPASPPTVIIAAHVDYTFAAFSPRLSFPSAVLAPRLATSLPLHATTYTRAWPCSSMPPASSSCQWQPELDSSSALWSSTQSSPFFVLNGSSAVISGCNGTCAPFLMMLQVLPVVFRMLCVTFDV